MNSARSSPTSSRSPRLGITAVLHAQGVDVIAETHSGRELVSVAAIERPDLVVVGQPADLSVADTVRRLVAPAAARRPSSRCSPPGRSTSCAISSRSARAASRCDRAAPTSWRRVIAAALKGEQHVAPALHGALAGAVRPRAARRAARRRAELA